ncbi:MAG: hypothetical protein ACREAX_00565 [Candidatus Nitrosotenuis sp.]
MLKIVVLLMVSVLLSAAIVSAVEAGQFAEAKKATNKQQRHKYSYWVGNKVCGDQLCEGQSYLKWDQKYRTFKSPYSAYEHQELSKIKTTK